MKRFSSYVINRGCAYVTTFTSMMLVLDKKVQEAITVFRTNNGQQNWNYQIHVQKAESVPNNAFQEELKYMFLVLLESSKLVGEH